MESRANGLLFDFGADETQTVGGQVAEPVYWNNVDPSVGGDDFGWVPNLLATDGNPTDVSLLMVSRFNGPNENGTAAYRSYPASATRDSLYGNTELFGTLENVTPIFKLSGLAAGTTCNLTFYASRMDVGDNRETRYTVTGATELFADLNAANNVTNTARISNMAPDAGGEVTIALTPGPNNNNGNHFTYLGILEVNISTGTKILIDFGAGGSITEVEEPAPGKAWNNVTATIGSDPAGTLTELVTTNGTVTTMGFQMVSRFNGANTAGTTTSTVFPTTATQDSLFGNTEAFNSLANIFPSFKLTGLDENYVYSFTFYASRNNSSDNRETRYTVTGANTGSADLNASNNQDSVVHVTNIRPNAAGEITVDMAPGPNNNNANHFTYIGAMQVDYEPVRTPRLLVDFGAPGRPTLGGTGDPDNEWNNLSSAGMTDTGALTNLVMTDGTASGINIQMVSRFNGVNENGTEGSTLYPLDATRDSLFGNTESFNELENITPIFKLTDLNRSTSYSFTFYASRMNVGDNRETRYTVTGASESVADLNVANNELEFVTVTNILPDAAGEITIALTPGPNNDNGNHFTYLGVLQVDWTASAPSELPSLSEPSYANGTFRFKLTGTSGTTYKIRRTRDFTTWEDAQTVTLAGASQTVEIPQTESEYFYQAVQQ